MFRLKSSAQNYDWGRRADESEVAQLAKANGNAIDETKPFAELWMGAHPNCPSKLAHSDESLQTFLDKYPQLLGAKVVQHFGKQLPYLFKVLSVAKALSIQSHPDKALAERLHKEHPKLYPDPNHKPEMALALSDFEALCGFASTAELQERLRRVPEVAGLVGQSHVEVLLALSTTAAADDAKQALKAAFTALMTASQDAVTSAVRTLVKRLRTSPPADGLTEHEALALRLNEQYPDDVGLMSAFFLNLVRLPKGHAIYLPANEPHAYLAGELVECMAASDNVIRAGLTPKFKHAEVLCESLTYRQGLPDILTGRPAGSSPGITVYQPPFEEFEIHRIECEADFAERKLTLSASEGPRILLVQSGEAVATVSEEQLPDAVRKVPGLESRMLLRRGEILLLAPSVELAMESPSRNLVIWVAAVNSLFFQLQDVRQAAGTCTKMEALAAQTVSVVCMGPVR